MFRNRAPARSDDPTTADVDQNGHVHQIAQAELVEAERIRDDGLELHADLRKGITTPSKGLATVRLPAVWR